MSKYLTPVELQQRGMELLIRELGYPDAVRFMLQYSRGHGNYTLDRQKIFAQTSLDDLIAATRRRTVDTKSPAKKRRKSA